MTPAFRAAIVAALLLPAAAAAAAPALTLHPGLQVNLSIYGGYSSGGDLLGDYDQVHLVTQVSGGGYTYQFRFTGPQPNRGTQTVLPEDNKHGTMLREYWPGGDLTMKGYISNLKVSDATYADIKAGKETKFEMDGEENPVSITKIGEEDLTTLVNEKPTKLHALKVKGKTKGTFWILDNAALPMLIRGESKWKWMVTSISDANLAGSDVVAALKNSGEATTHAIQFGFNSSDLDQSAKPVLDSVAQYLKANPKIALEIQGHTDNIGGAAPNLSLSQKRAEAVKLYLVAAGTAAPRLAAKGFGLAVPVADNATVEGRARNRRVVFSVQK